MPLGPLLEGPNMAKRKPIETVSLCWAFSFSCPHCSTENWISSIYHEDETKVGKICIPNYVACGKCNRKLETDYPPGMAADDEEKGEENVN